MLRGETVESAFAPVPERGAYVPRPATERAIRAVTAALAGGTRVVALRGPPGMGKSLLLRLLADHLPPGCDALHVATGALPLADLLAFALGTQGPRVRAAHGAREVLVLPIDDAEELTLPTARGLAGLVRKADGALRLVLAFRGELPEPVVTGLGGGLAEVALDEPMSEAEVALYLAVRCHRAGADELLRRRLGAAHAARLHRLSGGNPALLNRLASEILLRHALTQGGAPPAAAPMAALPEPLPRDPFGPTPTAAAYQPRSSSEALLGRIGRELAKGSRVVLVRGPGGIGKTTLLRLLEARLGEPYRVAAIPYAKLAPEEFFDYVLHRLGAPPSPAPEREVQAIASRLGDVGGTLVLALDDATALPADTSKCLSEAVATADGRLRVVGSADDEGAQETLCFPGAIVLRMEDRLRAAETAAYLLGRLAHFDAPLAVRQRFDAATIGALHRDSGGLPSELNRLAGEVERRALGVAPALAPPQPSTEPSLRAPAEAPASPVESAPRREPPPRPDWRRVALALLPHVGLGLGIPLALLALWLWLAPLFSAH